MLHWDDHHDHDRDVIVATHHTYRFKKDIKQYKTHLIDLGDIIIMEQLVPVAGPSCSMIIFPRRSETGKVYCTGTVLYSRVVSDKLARKGFSFRGAAGGIESNDVGHGA